MTAGYLSQMAGFGLLGFDPTIALIAVTGLLTGIRPRDVAVFLGTALVATPLFGTVLAAAVGRRFAGVDWWHLLRTGWWPAVVEFVVAALLVGWLLSRRRHGRTARAERAPRAGIAGAVGLALVLVLAWTADPGFVAGVVASGRTDSVLAMVLGQLVWVLIAQCLSVAVLVAMTVTAPQRLAERFAATWARTADLRFRLVDLALAVAAIGLVADAGWYLVSGDYLVG
ncbi:hypothetical protein [Skermania piniformis]|uniref:Sap, sulfolipid-1-addressing protein n=1 Tax=Skermania pinensis TaxID=39122 RepID=A0ABX8SD93_9ACTN|nr:hypothetical protein [Skermania piniformis]QXQ15117.1 hypothetical protein KV203_07165 [Skermania piniformis]